MRAYLKMSVFVTHVYKSRKFCRTKYTYAIKMGNVHKYMMPIIHSNADVTMAKKQFNLLVLVLFNSHLLVFEFV